MHAKSANGTSDNFLGRHRWIGRIATLRGGDGMVDPVEKSEKISKAEFQRRVPELRSRLLDAQFALQRARRPVVVIIAGMDGAGKGEVVHRLNEWLDPRGVDTVAFWAKTADEEEHPRFWRYWRVLPARNRVAILFGSWYTGPIIRRVYGKIGRAQFRTQLERIRFHENMLVEDGYVMVKIWLHLGRKAQRKRLKEMEKQPMGIWKVNPTNWEHHSLYDEFSNVSHSVMEETHVEAAPWHIIAAKNDASRDLAVGEVLVQTMENIAAEVRPKPEPIAPYVGASGPSILDAVDLTSRLNEANYQKQLKKYQKRVDRLMWEAHERKKSAILVFEGWDAGGKGSAIRRVTNALDPRLFRVIPVAAPTEEELSQHYLWRFWKHVPQAGRMTIFDRSWYGRVLVERIEKLASPAEWRRAYSEIRDFEAQLVEHGVMVSKFWLHISPEEQAKRFANRQETPWKQHKITPDDWRNREKWDEYEVAVNDMISETNTPASQWNIVPGNDKRFARIQILKTVVQMLENCLTPDGKND